MGQVPQGRIVQPERQNFWRRTSFRGMTPEYLSAILQGAERGELEDFIDLASFALRMDPHLRAVNETRVLSVAGAEIDVDPDQDAEDADLASQAASFCLDELTHCADFVGVMSALLHAEFIGLAGAEHSWYRRDGEWHSHPAPIPPRQVGLAPDWEPVVATYKDGVQQAWLHTRTDNPARYMLHIPLKFDTPNLAGDFWSVAWPWLWKRLGQVWHAQAMERDGMPYMFGVLPANSTGDTREAALAGLQRLGAERVGVMEGWKPEMLEGSKLPGESWEKYLDRMNNEISKALLGSTMNTEITSAGANRAAAESQAEQTILPKLLAHASRLSRTVEQQWFAPLLAFNAHLFGGRVPPVPKLTFKLHQDERPEISDKAVDSGVVKIDELRASNGLEPLGADNGGEVFIEKPAPPPQLQPSFSDQYAEATGKPAEPVEPTPEQTQPSPAKPEGENSRPLARSGRPSSRARKTSRMSLDWIKHLPSGRDD